MGDSSCCFMIKHTVRIGRIIAGIVFLVVGVILALPLIPGPGIAVVRHDQ